LHLKVLPHPFSHLQKAQWVGSMRNWKQATPGTT
jgi:hypothetical protein